MLTNNVTKRTDANFIRLSSFFFICFVLFRFVIFFGYVGDITSIRLITFLERINQSVFGVCTVMYLMVKFIKNKLSKKKQI